MTDDLALFLLVALVWALLAAAYALVPMLAMPGAALLWGAGAVVFALIARRVHAAGRTAGRSRGDRA